MTLTWLATEIRTGAIIETFTELTTDEIKDTIGQYETAQIDLPLAAAPPAWLRATKHGATVIHLVDASKNVCVWGGYVTQRVRSDAETVTLAVATIPAYFDRRYVGDKTYAATDQNAIVQDLVESFAASGSNGGIPIRVQVVGSPGTARDRTYADSDDKTLYSALQELMQVDGGPEWWVGWENGSLPDGRQTWTPVLYVGTRIGKAVDSGLKPNVTAELPGSASSVKLTEDYSADGGANDVLATSTPTGTGTRPASSHHVYADPDRPTFEKRITPSTSITDTGTLDDHATAELANVQDGTVSTDLEFISQIGTALGVDWSIGDDIGFSIGSADDPGRAVPAFPGGQSGVQRAWGWSSNVTDPLIVTPTLTAPGSTDAA